MEQKKTLKVFIGSSTEGASQVTDDGTPLLDLVAQWIERAKHRPLRWNDTNCFPLGEFTLESLLTIAKDVDAAVFILSGDDAMSIRGTDVKTPRDNVLIEYGLFMGSLGEKNVIAGRHGQPKVATDLLGVTIVDLSKVVGAENKVRLWLQDVEQRLLAAEKEEEAPETLSDHPYVELIASMPDRKDATVHALNTMAKELYGYRLEQDLVGQSADVLPGQLKKWIDPPYVHWHDLFEDQKLVYEQFYSGSRVAASIPVQFNRWHPWFPNKSFIPIILQRRVVQGNPDREITGVLYLDVATLPRTLFLERVWDEASQCLDLRQLADEVRVIAAAVDRPAPTFTGSKSEGSLLLAYFAEIGLYRAYEIARAKNLSQVKTLLREVLYLLPAEDARETSLAPPQ